MRLYKYSNIIVHRIPWIDVVHCNIDRRVYVHRSIEQRFAVKTRDVRTPFFLLRASPNTTTS